jgi:hypothetical protein
MPSSWTFIEDKARIFSYFILHGCGASSSLGTFFYNVRSIRGEASCRILWMLSDHVRVRPWGTWASRQVWTADLRTVLTKTMILEQNSSQPCTCFPVIPPFLISLTLRISAPDALAVDALALGSSHSFGRQLPVKICFFISCQPWQYNDANDEISRLWHSNSKQVCRTFDIGKAGSRNRTDGSRRRDRPVSSSHSLSGGVAIKC